MVKSGLDRPLGAAHDARNVSDGQILNEMEDQHIAVPNVESIQGSVDGRRVVWAKRRFVTLGRGRVLRVGLPQTVLRSVLADAIDGSQTRHPIEPRPQLAGVIELPDRSKRHQPDLLEDIQGRIGADELGQVVQERALHDLDQLRERIRFAVTQAKGEELVAGLADTVAHGRDKSSPWPPRFNEAGNFPPVTGLLMVIGTSAARHPENSTSESRD